MSSRVNISISSDKLAELIKAGHLCVADLNCLDAESKQQVWQLCLWSCNQRVHCTKPCTKQCNSGYSTSTVTDSKLEQQSALIDISAD